MVRTIIGYIIISFILMMSAMGQQPNGHAYSTTLSLMPRIMGSGETVCNIYNNVTINKSMIESGEKLKLNYEIRTPQVDNFDFVIAIDSSASLNYGEDPTMKNAIVKAVPEFVEKAINLFPDSHINISILSWDDDVDFAYSPFNNKDPKRARLLPIHEVENDLRINPVFSSESNENILYKTQENERTNLSLAIEASNIILDNNPSEKYYRTNKFIILIVGEGEYTECSEELIRETYEKGYSVYTIGLGVNKDSNLFHQLGRISGNNYRRTHFLIPNSQELEENLLSTLTDALISAVSEPVAEDVVITDLVDNYLIPERQASIAIIGLPESYTTANVTQRQYDGSTMLSLELPYSLAPNTITEVTVYLYFSLSELQKLIINQPESKRMDQISEKLPQPSITYTWFKSERFSTTLPRNQIDLDSISPSSKTKALWRLLFD